ncbi:MAG: phenylalanine--tRNA ligase subunit alpha [Chloroflexi bacterium]|nr:phenylalanine--tRNA ligase subunit alpha [Chloroflexota bacterium]
MSSRSEAPSSSDAPSEGLIETLRASALAELGEASDGGELDEWRVRYLGRKGQLTSILRSLASLPVEERRTVGAAANQLRTALEEQLQARTDELRNALSTAAEQLDVTLPGRRGHRGGLHPVTQTIRDITDAFAAMGFQTVEGPEVELERYNFDALNIPADHPARDLWDTMWVESPDGEDRSDMLLRTHTSPMQARVMEKTDPPVRVVVPGRCYRYEATDATHEWCFHQIEGLAVDEGISFADMKGTLYEFARRIFGSERKVRFRVDFFPFVEPGAEMAIDCFKCNGGGCNLCKQTGWIEILGAGMVHPKVLEGVGYDSEKYTGFAFGMGVERIAMLRHGIDDVRLFAAGDLRFLSQF